ncbi:MAG: hypothetical protein ACTSXP_18115 [Promethearchaeota archaeon]
MLRGFKRKVLPALLILTCSMVLFNLSVPPVFAHIIGPEIVEPTQGGWAFLDNTDNNVTDSVINDLERASANITGTGYGLFFAGTKTFLNHSRSGWFGAIGLNGSLIWERVISDPYFKNATSAMYNNTDEIYVAGYGPMGCMLIKVNFFGKIYWNITFGEPGDVLKAIAIIKIDGGITRNNNGITAIGMKSDGKTSFVINFNDTTRQTSFSYAPQNDANDSSFKDLRAVATDPFLPGIIYLGGKIVIKDQEKEIYHAFIEQLNISTLKPNWVRELNFSRNSEINAIQVEPTYGGVIAVGYADDDAIVYPLSWYDGSDGWALEDTPYLKWGGSEQDVATDVVILGEYTYLMYVSGWTKSYGSGGSKDFFMMKITFYKDIIWEKLWGAMKDDVAVCLTAEPAMAVFLGGASDGKAVIVENPSTNINQITRFFGSTNNVIVFLVISCTSIPATIVILASIILKRKKKIELKKWLDKKKKKSSASTTQDKTLTEKKSNGT